MLLAGEQIGLFAARKGRQVFGLLHHHRARVLVQIGIEQDVVHPVAPPDHDRLEEKAPADVHRFDAVGVGYRAGRDVMRGSGVAHVTAQHGGGVGAHGTGGEHKSACAAPYAQAFYGFGLDAHGSLE